MVFYENFKMDGGFPVGLVTFEEKTMLVRALPHNICGAELVRSPSTSAFTPGKVDALLNRANELDPLYTYSLLGVDTLADLFLKSPEGVAGFYYAAGGLICKASPSGITFMRSTPKSEAGLLLSRDLK